ncbi:MAG TPA: translocation/assembly module TamB domain-containing protein [Gemmatimonadales bacterium]|jgi:translocation and assembly module TamB|nr:translocation/assembly module TamB domain-containing protein [Gemmatimonadales bacterium]
MVRRSLGVALWSLVGLLACFLGALSGLVGTRAGRSLLARVASDAIEGAVSGTIEVGDVRGPLLSGVILTDVRLFDPDSTLVAFLPRAELSYNPIDFAAGRIVLFEVKLDRPVFNIVEHANGKVNLEELLRLDVKKPGPRGPRTLIELRNVWITDGSVALRLQDGASPGDSILEIDRFGGDGRRRVRRFEHLNARLAALRLSAPRERGIRIDITRLAFESSDPELTVTDAAGRLTIRGDTLDADLVRLRLPASLLSARGTVSWPRGTLLFDLALRADSGTLTDVHFVDPRFPPGAVLHGGVTLHSHGARVLEIRLDPLDVTYGGGRLTGRVTAFSAADSGIVALRQGDLVASDLSLELARPFLDTLPFAGRLTGRTLVDGAMSALGMDVDWSFRDSLVPGWPETRIRGKGQMDVGGADLGFRPFEVEAATVDLGTVRRLIPAFALGGELDAVGTVTGTLHQTRFSGTLRHRDRQLPASVVRGVVALDSRSDTLGVFADVTADSLSLDGLRASFPDLPLQGTLAGTIKLDGDLAGLETHADLAMGGAGSGERVKFDGVLELGAPGYGARDVTLRGHDVNLAHWLRGGGGPPSRLGFTLTGSLAADSATPSTGDLTLALAPSFFAGSVLDSGAAKLHFTDRRLYVESLHLQQPGLVTVGSGSLGWKRPERGSLSLDFTADSLSVLDSLVTWVAGPGALGENPAAGEGLTGSARVLLTLDGALDSVAVEARISATNLAWRGWHVPAGRGHATLEPGGTGEGGEEGEPASPARFSIEATLDSLGYGRLGFGAASASARGSRDSLTWFARSRIGDLGAFLAGGRYAKGEAGGGGELRRLGVDSLAVLLPGSVWFLEQPTELTYGDSALSLDTLSLRSAQGGGSGRLVIGGSLPTRGAANARVYLETFPLAGVYAMLQHDTMGVAGAVTATVAMTGSRANPVYAGSFALSDAAFGGGAFRAPFMDGTVEYRGRRLDGQLHLWRSGQQVLTVTAHLPLDLALTEVAQRQLPDTLSVQARADSVDLTVLEAVTPLVRQVRGVFSADLGLGGTWDAPRLRGGLEITGAGATIPALNVRYDDINGRLALGGDTIRVDTLTARSEKGRAEVTGHVRLDQLTRPVLGLNIAATEFKALDLKGYLAVTASGRLSLQGPVLGATLTGRGTVTSGVLHFADLVNKRVVNLDEPWVQDLIDTSLIRRQRLGPEFESVFLDSLQIQGLQLTMGSDVWLRSTEANIQLTGSVTVNKLRDNYLLSGTLQAPRGTYRLVVGPVTREFVVNQGTVRYFGTPDLDAELDIEARHVVHPAPGLTQRTTEDITIVAHIRGTLLVPRLTLEAERQQLSQSEIISYLMFAKPSPELGGGQAALARSTAASLVAGELERTVVSDLGVPLDYFEIRPGDPADPFSGAQFAAGWQIGDKTFLVLNAGFCQKRQTRMTNMLGASLQYRISPEWRTEASFEPVRTCATEDQQASATRQLGFDLFWEKRY